MHLVKIIASKIAIFLPRHIDPDDLIHEGLVGLIDAAIKYNCNLGMKFSSYAAIRIKGAILDSLRSMDWVPRRIRKISKCMEKVREEMQQTLKREPTIEEIADYMKIAPIKLRQIMSDIEDAQVLSFEDLKIFANRYYSSGDRFSAITYTPEYTDYEMIEIKEQIKKAISELNEREKTVLALYYIEDLTLKEIKYVLEISEARISQIHTSAIRKLRAKMTEKEFRSHDQVSCAARSK